MTHIRWSVNADPNLMTSQKVRVNNRKDSEICEGSVSRGDSSPGFRFYLGHLVVLGEILTVFMTN